MRLLPDIALEHFARDDLTLIAEEILEHVDFAGGQGNLLPAADRRASARVQLQIATAQEATGRPHWPSQQRAAPRQHFGKREWFRQVVIRAAVEPDDAVV